MFQAADSVVVAKGRLWQALVPQVPFAVPPIATEDPRR